MWASSKEKPSYGAIIDVHSGSVGMAIVHTDPDIKDPEILYAFREYIKVTEHPDTTMLVRALRHALFTATLQFSQEGMRALKAHDSSARIEKLLVVCGAPWAQTVTRFIHIGEETPFVVTKEKLQSLIAETERKDEEELKASELLKDLNVSLIERAVVNVTANGYPVRAPYGKKVTELSLAHISGLIPHAITEAVKEIEEKVLTHTSRSTHTFALVLFCVLRELYPHTKNALFVDVSGEATELCIMQDEVLLDTLVFPQGSHTIIRDVAQSLKTFPDEALTHIRNMSPESPEAVRLAILKATETYIAGLKEAYTTLAQKYVIPKSFFLTASRKLDSFLDNVVRQASSEYLGSQGTFISLHKTFLEKEIATQKTIPDIFFLTEARFFHKIHMCGEIIE